MLPLTAPNELPESLDLIAEVVDRENGVTLAVSGPSENSVPQQASIATPISTDKMGLDNMDGRSDMEEESESQDLSDEDQDMSDGGAELSNGAELAMTLAQASDLNAEMDMLDAEIIGNQNVLFHDSNYPSNLDDDYPFYYSEPFHEEEQFPQLSEDDSNYTMEYGLTQGIAGAPYHPGTVSGLPAAMSELSEQLQHIQDGQDNADFASVSDTQNGALDNMEDQFNLSLGDFLYAWGRSAMRDEEPRRRTRGPALPAASRQRDLINLEPMEPCELQGDKCDIQRLDWTELGVTRLEARHMRRQTYKNYTNLRFANQSHADASGPKLSEHEDYFKFRRMDFDHDVHLSHFQLRNLLACATRDHIFYGGRSKVMHYSPMEGKVLSDRYSVAMDLTQPTVQPFHGNTSGGVQISTMTIGHNILVAGGFCGEYGITNLRAHKDFKHAEGIITDDPNAITNHVQVHLSRSSSLPLAAFASNDKEIRILDVETNTFIANHKYEHAINCSAISPDQRLRVLTGDCRKVMICNAETGEILQELDGHQDYGFACDWADDGWTVATGNQDMQVKIWDARKWKSSSGMASPVATIPAEMAGVRKLKFSPLGSGKRVLVAAEPADIVNVINAETFTSKQTLSFFGEIGGVDFTNNGSDLIVANCDSMRGGIMEYERCGLGNEGFYELDAQDGWRERRKGRSGPGPKTEYDWMSNEDAVRHPISRGTNRHRTRRPAMSASPIGGF